MSLKSLDLTLQVLVDPMQLDLKDLLPFCQTLRTGGATVVQLRGKHSSGLELFRYGMAFRDATRQTGLGLVVDDRADVAVAVGADGVHVGQDDLPLDAIRQFAPDLAIGLSVGTYDELTTARSLRPDYIGMGPIYPTLSKLDAGSTLGIKGFQALCREAHTVAPVIAIGGIQASNVGPVWRAGANGIAVISAVMSASDRAAACRLLLQSR